MILLFHGSWIRDSASFCTVMWRHKIAVAALLFLGLHCMRWIILDVLFLFTVSNFPRLMERPLPCYRPPISVARQQWWSPPELSDWSSFLDWYSRSPEWTHSSSLTIFTQIPRRKSFTADWVLPWWSFSKVLRLGFCTPICHSTSTFSLRELKFAWNTEGCFCQFE